MRETLFNWLQIAHRGRALSGSVCRLRRAGTGGAVARRGRRGFIEHQRIAADALRVLLQQWQAVGASVLCQSAQQYLAGARDSRPFDVVFIDPPFAAGRAGELRFAIDALSKGWLAPEARLYLERAKTDPPLGLDASWQELRAGTAGEVRYHLFARSSEGGRSPP